MKSQSNNSNNLDNEVERIIVELRDALTDALSPDMRELFGDYTFLTLFAACPPHTPRGIRAALRSVKRAGRRLESRKESGV